MCGWRCRTRILCVSRVGVSACGRFWRDETRRARLVKWGGKEKRRTSDFGVALRAHAPVVQFPDLGFLRGVERDRVRCCAEVVGFGGVFAWGCGRCARGCACGCGLVGAVRIRVCNPLLLLLWSGRGTAHPDRGSCAGIVYPWMARARGSDGLGWGEGSVRCGWC